MIKKADAELCQQSFELLTSDPDVFSRDFYNLVFLRAPNLRSLFPEDMFAQGRKLYELLNLTMGMLASPPQLVPSLQALGKGHAAKGVLPEHYPIIVEALVDTLGDHLGEGWTKAFQQAWRNLLSFVAQNMIDGAMQHAA